MDAPLYSGKIIYVHAGTVFDIVLTLPVCITVKIRGVLCTLDLRDFTVVQKKRSKEIAMALVLGREVVIRLEGEREKDVYPVSIYFQNKSLQLKADSDEMIEFGAFLEDLVEEDPNMGVSSNILMG